MENHYHSGLSISLMCALSENSISALYKYAQKNELSPIQTGIKRGLRYSIKDTRHILQHFFAKKHKIDVNKKKLVGFHFKGGTGKSSINTEISVMLSLLGYNVLIVDGDQQGHASHTLGLSYSDKFYTLYDSVKNNLLPQDIIVNLYEGLDCIPANLSLAEMDENLKDLPENERLEVIYKLISQVEQQYDFIIFDTAPSITDLNRNIFYLADVLNIVCDTQPQSVQSLEHIMEYIHSFCSKHGKRIPKIVVIPNKYEDRTSSSLETMTYLKNYWEKYIIPNFAVRKSEDFPKAFLQQIPISFFCKVNSIAFEDVAQIVRHLINICEYK